MNTKNIFALSAVLVLAIGGALFYYNQSRTQPQTAPKVIKVGVSQIVSHPVFDEFKKGIIQGFKNGGYEEGKNIVFDFQNANGDNNVNQAIANKFAAGDYDLFMPMGTQSTQALANLIKDRPIVFAGVTDPVLNGVVASKEKPGANITGTSDIVLYKEHLELIKKLVPDAKKVGILYNPGETNSVFGLQQAEKYASELGLEIVTAPVNNTGEVLVAAQSIVEKVDVFYMINDNTVLAGQESLIKISLENKKPLIAIEESGVEMGALATLGTTYSKVGERAAELAIKVINGESPANLSVVDITDSDLFLNKKTALAIGIQLPEDLLGKAVKVYEE